MRWLPNWSTKSPYSVVNWVLVKLPEVVTMAVELLRASEAARRLDMPTKELLRLVYDRKIRYVMVKGIVHVPGDAIQEYRAKAS